MKGILKFWLVLAVPMAVVCARSEAAGDIYLLALPGISGNARGLDQENLISVTGFQYPGISGSAESFYVQKNFDSASAPLLLASVAGTVMTSATFYCESANGSRVFTMIFGDLMVDAWQSADMGTTDLVPMEKVSFSFDSLSIITYSPRVKGAGPPVTTLIFAPPMHN
jgi:hypothetical protein